MPYKDLEKRKEYRKNYYYSNKNIFNEISFILEKNNNIIKKLNLL